MNNPIARSWRHVGLSAIILLHFVASALAQELAPGKTTEISFPGADLPPPLYSVMSGTESKPCLPVRLPDDFNPTNKYPLLVYVPGNDGGPEGNIGNAETIAGPRGWIVASVPLFKKSVDRNEVSGGVLVSMEDFPALSKAYQTMLGRLFDRVPNIDREKSALVGFSNGAITIGVLVSGHDEFVLTHFQNFCLVDQGMFHLTDLHKKYARDCRYLILVGDQPDLGRDLKIRQSRLQQDSWKLLGVNLSCQIMKDTGHEFQDRHMALVGKWLRNEAAAESAAREGAAPSSR